MRFTGTHPTRLAQHQDGDLFDLYRQIVLFDFHQEIRAGFFLSYYRNFAIPSIARTLAGRGEMQARPMKRSYDTGIVIHEIIANGFDSDRGQQMVELLRRVHRGVPGTSEDFLYVLMTLLVLPLRWVDRHGWRKLTPREEEAAVAFYAELGARMGLAPAPSTFADAEEFLDDYEARHMGPSPEGAQLLDATVAALKNRLPRPLHRFTGTVLALMMDKPEVALALGLKPSPAWLRIPFDAILWVRALRTRMQPLPASPSFVSGGPVSHYPDGYTLDMIGPHS